MNWINIAIESALSFFVTLTITLYLERVLRNKKMTVPDAHKKDKPLIPRPGGFSRISGNTSRSSFCKNSYALAFIFSLLIVFFD